MAEGGLQEVSNIVGRAKELAVQSASDTITNSERYMINLQIDKLKDSINQISGANMLFGHQLLNGKSSKLDLQIDSGASGSSRISVDLSDLDNSTDALGLSSIDLSSKVGSQKALESLDRALDKVGGTRAKLGGMQKRFISTADKLQTDIYSFKAADSRLMDTDFAKTTADYTATQIKESVTTSVQSQANTDMKQALKLIG